MLNMLQRLLPARAGVPTFGKLAMEWRRTLKGRWSREAGRILDRHILPAIGDLPADKVILRDCSMIVEALTATPGIHNHAVAIMKRVFKWSRKTGRFPGANPADDLGKLHLEARERELTNAELRQLWSLAPYLGDWGLVCRLILLTGRRPGEIGGLTWDAVVYGPALYLGRTKNKKGYVVPLSPLAASFLPRRRDGHPHLFGTIEGKPFNGWGAGNKKWKSLTRAKCPWYPHALRKTAATRMGGLGVPDEVIERILGHKPPGVTRRHYNFAQRLEEQRDALERWAAELERIISS